jgi:hypothetical protein
MPLARGLMLMNGLNVYGTRTTMTIVESAPYTCGETVHFSVTVANTTSGTPVPTGGTVQIFDLVSMTVLASGTLVSGAVTIPVMLSGGTINVIARYQGNLPTFTPSLSANIPISAAATSTVTTLTAPANHVHFCASQNLAFTATVSAGATGNVQFYYSLNNVTFTLFATSALSAGSASATLPGGTLAGSTDGNEVYFQAVYVGSGCFGASTSTLIDGYAYDGLTTGIIFSTPMDSPGIGYFTMHGVNQVPGVPVVLNMNSALGTVTDGSVTLYCAYESSGTPPDFTFPTLTSPWAEVPSGVGVGADTNPVTVTSNTVDFNFTQGSGPTSFFSADGTYYFVAIYTSTDSCFAGSHTTFTAASAYHIFVNEE